jgi:paraquat-inducible protein B
VALSAGQLGSIAVGDPVYYREVQVGEVTAIGLEDTASSALVHALIRERYAPLVREGSLFWNASGLHFNWGLFKGASLDLESLKALLAGGVAFATPDAPGGPAANGSHFALHDKPEDEWLTWRPTVRLGPADSGLPLPRIVVAANDFSVDDLAPAAFAVQSASHVRQGPGTIYRVIDTLAKGASVEVTGKVQDRDWYRVRLGSDGVGYVWSPLLQPEAQQAAQ